jgi:2-methylcitrate dehydratase
VDKTIDVLTEYSTTLRFDDLGNDVVHEVKRKLIDTVGCIFSAFDAEPCRIARAVARRAIGNPPARILGTLEPTTPEHAAFANGVMLRFLDYNDSYLGTSSCHPSDVWPAVLAVADAAHANGKTVITAAVLAYEACCNLPDVMPREQGWDNVLYDTIGSALGAAKVLKLDTAEMAHALALAIVPNVALEQTRLGELTMWKGCAGANAARNGVFAALLAQAGVTAPRDVVDGKWGLSNLLGHNVAPAPLGGRGGPFRIARTHIKYYPGVVHAQSAIGAALELSTQVRPADIGTITIDMHWPAQRYVDRHSPLWHPNTSETADHSIPYLVAVALADGRIDATSCGEERIHDPALAELMTKMTVRENPEYTAAYPQRWQCRIEIVTKSGVRKSAYIEYFKGHVGAPLTDAEVESKFHALTAKFLAPDCASAIIENIWRLDALDDIDAVLALCSVRNELK